MIQVLITSCVSAAIYAVLAISFAVIFNVARFFHFAHGAIFTFGAYAVYVFAAKCNLPFAAAVLLAVLASGWLGLSIDALIYKPLRNRRASSLVLLVASLGIMIALQNCISLFFGDETKSYGIGSVEPGWLLFGARITGVQIAIIVISAVAVAATCLVFAQTRLGTIMRAIGEDQELSAIIGIRTERHIGLGFAAGSALASVGASLMALNSDLSPTLGFDALLVAVVAVVLGGVGNVFTAALGGIFIGFLQNFVAWKLSSDWHNAIVFGILILVLLFRPTGIGRRHAKSARK
jgi:branched-chain amino acid transport system permease protein